MGISQEVERGVDVPAMRNLDSDPMTTWRGLVMCQFLSDEKFESVTGYQSISNIEWSVRIQRTANRECHPLYNCPFFPHCVYCCSPFLGANCLITTP